MARRLSAARVVRQAARRRVARHRPPAGLRPGPSLADAYGRRSMSRPLPPFTPEVGDQTGNTVETSTAADRQ